VVLNRRTLVLGALLAAGCKHSLFDNGDSPGRDAAGHEDDAATPGRDAAAGADGPIAIDAPLVVPVTCPAPCIADAARDFDGSATGANGRWRYLDDHRNRTWAAMTGDTVTRRGADPANHVTTCAASTANAACVALPGALLVASAGSAGTSDPALEVTVPTAQVIQLSLRAFIAAGPDQRIRLYRNSREDVLFTGTAVAGTELDQALTLDALAGDRFLVAIAPITGGAEVAVHLFASTVDATFPATCQVAMSFAAAAGNTVDNLCGADFTHRGYDTDLDTPPPLSAGPYAELGTAGDFVSDSFFLGTATLDKSRDTTVQLWAKRRTVVDDYDTWLFSDMDLNTTGGIGISITNDVVPLLDFSTTLTVGPLTYIDALTPYPDDAGWHFIRVVQRGGTVYVCLDGTRRITADVAPGFLRSSFPPYLGANVLWSPQGAFLDGALDDVRVISSALPCDE